ncbi:hypothetical protein CD33_11005 [Ureibacillus sinduriensis BLB-1 = JCM 15800]|uniref:Uncharacterized protein n=1 Tax=Ureibacillus sinduriensis BLB-1 = JCM 15800 TaxID=1384057 RepID=A0A0A3ILE5_9BACL|nr:hypothetical protein CD33_11005 [Ureibacillus sinduriensis BLB-1 = JCM 15800]
MTRKHAVGIITPKSIGSPLNFTVAIHIILASPATKRKAAMLQKYGQKINSITKRYYVELVDMSLQLMNIWTANRNVLAARVPLTRAVACTSIYTLKHRYLGWIIL